MSGLRSEHTCDREIASSPPGNARPGGGLPGVLANDPHTERNMR